MKSISKVIKVLSYIKKGSQLKKYGKILEYARSNGYHILALDYWFTHLEEFYNKKVLILRHDVDQMPSSALAIASVEKKHSVNSSFYFRWSTAKGKVINKIKEMGSTIGFHYETLN